MDDCDWLLSVEKACDWLRIEPGVTVKFFLGHLVGSNAANERITPLPSAPALYLCTAICLSESCICHYYNSISIVLQLGIWPTDAGEAVVELSDPIIMCHDNTGGVVCSHHNKDSRRYYNAGTGKVGILHNFQ